MRGNPFHLRALFIFLCLECALVFGRVADGPPIRVEWVTEGGLRVEVRGLDAGLLKKSDEPGVANATLRVFAGGPGAVADDTPAMAGAYRVDGDVLIFEPQFPPQPGVTYRAVVRAGNTGMTAPFSVAAPVSKATVVTNIYPTTSRLPENLLKFYVHFSGPMRRGGIYDHIRLLDEAGKDVELPFLEIDEELWDPGMTRLTLFIDPGRIKRGVAPLEDIGPALEAGKRFRLVIGGEWLDAAGAALGRAYEKPFEVGPPDRDPPDPARWKVTPAPAGGRGPVVLSFAEPMDHALALRLITVTDRAGKPVAGTPTLVEGETQWQFAPDAPWVPGAYRVAVRATVEDLSGNNVGKPFDVDLDEGAKPGVAPEVVTIPFDVR